MFLTVGAEKHFCKPQVTMVVYRMNALNMIQARCNGCLSNIFYKYIYIFLLKRQITNGYEHDTQPRSWFEIISTSKIKNKNSTPVYVLYM